VQAAGRVARLAAGLFVLQHHALVQHFDGHRQVIAGDVHHRDVEVREGQVAVDRERALERVDPLAPPGGVPEPEQVAPVVRLERHGPAPGSHGLRELAGAHQQEGQRGMALGQRIVQIDAPAGMADRRRQAPGVGRIPGASGLVKQVVRVRESRVGQRVPRVEPHGALEALGRGRHLRRVEAVELHTRFRRRAERIEVRCLAHAHAR